MRSLGILALPHMVKRVEQGEVDLIPAISELTDGALKKTATRSECLEWWNKAKDKSLVVQRTTE